MYIEVRYITRSQGFMLVPDYVILLHFWKHLMFLTKLISTTCSGYVDPLRGYFLALNLA